jgi:hypothetical protein
MTLDIVEDGNRRRSCDRSGVGESIQTRIAAQSGKSIQLQSRIERMDARFPRLRPSPRRSFDAGSDVSTTYENSIVCFLFLEGIDRGRCGREESGERWVCMGGMDGWVDGWMDGWPDRRQGRKGYYVDEWAQIGWSLMRGHYLVLNLARLRPSKSRLIAQVSEEAPEETRSGGSVLGTRRKDGQSEEMGGRTEKSCWHSHAPGSDEASAGEQRLFPW